MGQAPPPSHAASHEINDVRKVPEEQRDSAEREFFDAVQTDIGYGRIHTLSLDEAPDKKKRYGLDGVYEPGNLQDKSEPQIFNLSVGRISISIKNMLIRGITVNGSDICFKNCLVSEIHFNKTNPGANVFLTDCWVGSLYLAPLSLDNLTIRGGSVRSFKLPAGGGNPFKGSVDISDDVELPTSTQRFRLFKGAQPYRNLRIHLEELQNGPAANLMRARELRTERETENGLFVWLVNWYYGTFADYGRRPGRPLWCVGILFFVMASIAWLDGGAPGLLASNLNQETGSGWQISLLKNDNLGRFWRSIILAGQAIANPLGIISPRTLVAADSGLCQTALTTLGLVVDLMIVTTVISIRRRFKIG